MLDHYFQVLSARYSQERVVYFSVVMWVTTIGQLAQAAEFFPLGTLPGDVGSWSGGVSDNGVAGGSSFNRANSPREAFRWTEETGMVGLGMLPAGAWSRGAHYWIRHGVSGDGSTIVGSGNTTPSMLSHEAFIYNEADGMRGLGMLPGGDDSEAVAVSYDGKVVVGWSEVDGDAGVGEAFRWTEADGMVGLGRPLNGTRATHVSGDGSVIVGLSYPGDVHAQPVTFIWTGESGMRVLGSFGYPAVSSDGVVVVGATTFPSDENYQAIRWTADTGPVGLGWLPSTEGDDGSNFSVANGLNAAGSTIVGSSGLSAVRRAFIWTEPLGIQDLQQSLVDYYGLGAALDGWSLSTSTDISPNGLFINGYGTNPDGNHEAWLVRLDAPWGTLPVPEPTSIALALGIAVMCGLLLRRQSTVPPETTMRSRTRSVRPVFVMFACVILPSLTVEGADVVSVLVGSGDLNDEPCWDSALFPDNGNAGFTCDAVANSFTVTIPALVDQQRRRGSRRLFCPQQTSRRVGVRFPR